MKNRAVGYRSFAANGAVLCVESKRKKLDAETQKDKIHGFPLDFLRVFVPLCLCVVVLNLFLNFALDWRLAGRFFNLTFISSLVIAAILC